MNGRIERCSRQPLQAGHVRARVVGSLAGLLLVCGCATPPPPPEKVVTPPPPPTTHPAKHQKEMSGQLVQFGKLRVVIMAKETIVNAGGQETKTREILPVLEKELAQRGFRVFNGLVASEAVAEVTRNTKAQLVVLLLAKSQHVNSTGEFAKYRATVEAKAIRGYDCALLTDVRKEQLGQRQQDESHAGQVALRAVAEEVSKKLVDGLLAKTDQLCWAGLIVNHVPDMKAAMQIQQGIGQKSMVTHVELLDWQKGTGRAYFEIIYGLPHESNLIAELQDIRGVQIRPSAYQPDNMDIFRKTMAGYK